MSNLSPKTKLYLTAGIIVALFAALFLFIALPLIGKISATSQEYLDIKQQIANIEENRNQIMKLEKEYDAIKEKISKIDATLANPSDFLNTIIKLEQIGEKTGNKYKISVIDEPAAKKSAEPKQYLPFRVILYGDFAGAMDFINKLENADFYANIEKMEMSKLDKLTLDQASEGVKEGDIRTIMEIRIFTK